MQNDDRVQLITRVAPELRELLKARAALEGRSVNELVIQAIHAAIPRDLESMRLRLRAGAEHGTPATPGPAGA